MEDLKVTVGADITGFKKGMDDAQKELAQTAIAAGKLDSALKKSSAGFNTTGQSLQNLGRIAQDAPFGFIGIQNNINPLIESFGRLKAETGSTGKAFKALFAGLLGPAGIGLAVSVVTGILTVLAQNGFFKTGKASNEAAEEIKKFNKTINETKSAGIAAGLSLQGFVNIAKDQTQSLETRNEALKQANKIMGEHGEKLTLVNVATAAVTEQINKFTEATIQQALANKFSDRAADLIIKQMDAAKAYGIELKELRRVEATRLKGNSSDIERVTALTAATYKTTQAANIYKTIRKEIISVTGNLSDAQQAAAKLFGELGTKTKPEKEKAKKDLETIADVLRNVRHQIDDVNNPNADLFGVNAAKENVSVLSAAITHLLDKFKGSAGQGAAIIKLKAEIDSINLHESLKNTVYGIETFLKAKPIEMPLTVTPPTPLKLKEAFIPISKSVLEFQALVTESMKNISVEALSGLGEAIGTALGGKNPIKGLFDNIFSSVGDQLKALGKFLIQSAITVKLAKDAFAKLLANPILAIAAGVGLIALGAFIKSQIGKTAPGFAGGGYIDGPGTKTSDSIHARLSKGEYVIKADSVSKFGKSFFDMINGGGRPRNGGYASGGSVIGGSIGGGQLITVEVVGNIRGNDIYIANRRTALKVGRNG